MSQTVAQRIVSLLPSATEILFALGLGDRVLGISHECDFPPATRDKEVLVRSAFDPRSLSAAEIDSAVSGIVGQGKSVYVVHESLLQELRPDLIVTQTLCDVCAVSTDHIDAVVRSLPQPLDVLSLHPHTLDDVLEDIRRVGNATDTDTFAAELVANLRERIEAVQRATAHISERPRVACIEWYEPLYTGGHWVPQMVDIAGGVSTLSAPGEPSVRVEWETVIAGRPDVIVLMPCGYNLEETLADLATVTKLPGWRELPAVRNGRVYAVSGTDYFNRPGPRLVDGLEILAWILHPELFPAPRDPAGAKQLAVSHIM